MIETPLGAPGAPRPASLQTAVDTLMAEAEKITAEIATLRCSLELAEHKRHKLVTALGSAVEALPKRAHEALNHRMQNLAKAMSPKRGRRPDSRQQAIIEYLATRAHYDEEVVKVAEVQRPIWKGWATSACPTVTPPTPWPGWPSKASR
jgi:hypothetical protein